jgi:acetyltransferase-like isoleucine patch superfamily enzyme
MNPSNHELQEWFSQFTSFKNNQFHPLVWINGDPIIGKGTFIGAMSEVNAKGAQVTIGENCDIASFVSINVADSHKRCIGVSDEIERSDIYIGRNVFIGSHSLVKGGARIGNHSVIASGTIVDSGEIPPYSLVSGNPMNIRPYYYKAKINPAG